MLGAARWQQAQAGTNVCLPGCWFLAGHCSLCTHQRPLTGIPKQGGSGGGEVGHAAGSAHLHAQAHEAALDVARSQHGQRAAQAVSRDHEARILRQAPGRCELLPHSTL